MKLISTISLLLINFCQTSGQTIREFENELRKRPITLSAVQDVIDRFKKNKEGVVFLKQRHRISYFELLYSKFLIRDTTTEYNSWISLITYSKNDLIFSFLLEAQTNFTEGISYQDSAIAKKNIEEFNTNNTTDYKWQDQFRETGFDIFGITWGLP